MAQARTMSGAGKMILEGSPPKINSLNLNMGVEPKIGVSPNHEF